MKCNRCHTETNVHTMSMFNTQDICMTCKEKEKLHPLYEMAVRVELNEVKQGNFNFKGIGLPTELKLKATP